MKKVIFVEFQNDHCVNERVIVIKFKKFKEQF